MTRPTGNTLEAGVEEIAGAVVLCDGFEAEPLTARPGGWTTSIRVGSEITVFDKSTQAHLPSACLELPWKHPVIPNSGPLAEGPTILTCAKAAQGDLVAPAVHSRLGARVVAQGYRPAFLNLDPQA